jgi:hypothetical protein
MIARAARRGLGLLRWLVRLEIGIWRSLFLWITRRIPGRGPGIQSFSYAKEESPLIGAFVFVSALELPVAHLLIPWEPVRLALLIVGVWGLLWMIGFLASVRVFRHLLDDSSLRVRRGTGLDVTLRWEDIATVRAARGRVPTNRLVHLDDGEHGTIARVAVLKQTRVAVALRQPTAVALPDEPTVISEIHFYVDNPRALVAAASEHLAARTTTAPA